MRNDLWRYVPDPDCPGVACGKSTTVDETGFNLPFTNYNTAINIEKDNFHDEALGVLTDELKIYPNPNSGKFMIAFSAGMDDQYGITIYNSLEQVVFFSEENVHAAQVIKEIDLGDIAPGLYFTEIKSGKIFLRQKLLIVGD